MKREVLVCPFCGAPCQGIPTAGRGHVMCNYCGGLVLVPSRSRELYERCQNHPELQPIGLCSQCHKGFCGRCLHVLRIRTRRNAYLCPTCMEPMMSSYSQLSKFARVGAILFILQAALVAVSMAFDEYSGIVSGLMCVGAFFFCAIPFGIKPPSLPTVEEREPDEYVFRADLGQVP